KHPHWLERTDGHVVSVRIQHREFLRLSVRVEVRLFFKPVDKSACSLEGHLVVVDTKEQEEAVAGSSVVRTHQGGMLVRAPLVEAKQNRSIRIEDLAPVVMARSCLGLAEERLVPFEAARNVPYADDGPYAFHLEILDIILRSFGQSFFLSISPRQRGCPHLHGSNSSPKSKA